MIDVAGAHSHYFDFHSFAGGLFPLPPPLPPPWKFLISSLFPCWSKFHSVMSKCTSFLIFVCEAPCEFFQSVDCVLCPRGNFYYFFDNVLPSTLSFCFFFSWNFYSLGSLGLVLYASYFFSFLSLFLSVLLYGSGILPPHLWKFNFGTILISRSSLLFSFLKLDCTFF